MSVLLQHIPCPDEVTDEIKREVAEFVVALEHKYQLRCAVVYNPYRIGFGENLITFSLIACPAIGENSENISFESRLRQCFDHLRHLLMFGRTRRWHCHFGGGLSDWSLWFQRFKETPEKFPLSGMASGADLISYVVYGEQLMEEVRRAACEFFGENILHIWQEYIPKHLLEKRRKARKAERDHIRYCRERSELLNRHELAELKAIVFHVAAELQIIPTKAIVALDGSARPIAKALSWFLDSPPPIISIDPHCLKRTQRKDNEHAEIAATVLARELPDLAALWRDNLSEVLFIDDQTGYGSTLKGMEWFTRYLAGDGKMLFLIMTRWDGSNMPSWLHKRNIQGLRLAEDRVTFLAEEAPTAESEDFYKRLHQHVLQWKQEQQ